jgi:hypothetical protein
MDDLSASSLMGLLREQMSSQIAEVKEKFDELLVE